MKALFVFAGMLTGFFAGVFYGVITVPRSSGLAGPAVVLGYGVVMAMVSIVFAFWINAKLNATWRKRITITLLLICLVPITWMYYQYKTNRSNQGEPTHVPESVTPVKE